MNERNENQSPENGPDHELRVYSDITQLVASPENPTPLVRINRANRGGKLDIYLKLERHNPFGSVKDRIAREMLAGLERDGKTVVEPSSGNTGIALAGLANALGIPVTVAVPDRIPEEKKVLLRFLGAELMEADDALCPLFPTEGARGLVNALVNSPATRDRYVSPNQYENELNVRAHYRTTGPEIWRQTRGRITHFFAGLGTCGTITGVGKYLKEQNPDIKIIGIEPAAADHNLPGLKRITGLAEEYVPKILVRSVIDDLVAVADDDAYRTASELARQDGLLVGPTTGAIVHAALRYAREGEGLAVAISPDDAFKYASLYREYLSRETTEMTTRELDLTGVICPLSKVKAVELLDTMTAGESAKILVADDESLKSVAKELKARGVTSSYRRDEAGRHVFSVTK